MPTSGTHWSTEQLAEFLAAVSGARDEGEAIRASVERAAEAFESEVAALVRDGSLLAVIGFPRGSAPEEELVRLSAGETEEFEFPKIGPCSVALGTVEGWASGGIVLARAGGEGYSPQERALLRSMAKALGLTLGMLERQRLLERLTKIQRSISHRAPLQEVLDAITQGAADLLGVEVVGLRLVDPQDPAFARTASAAGVEEPILNTLLRTPVGEGAGGQAIVRGELVIVEDYANVPGMVPRFTDANLQTAMAAPVHEDGSVVGSLVVASYTPGRRFSESEQEALLALAEHASLALTDARTVEAMREAQRSKDMFLAMVSHELKTPLTVIMGTLRTLEVHGEDLHPELVAELLSKGWQRGRELERLINRLLQGARAELAGSEEDTTVTGLLGEALDGWQGVRLVDAPEAVVRVDRAGVLEIVGILLENAVSHSPEEDEVLVHATIRDVRLEISVSNRGSLPSGVEPAELFHPFLRGPDARSPGVGLGLYIAGRVAASIGGEVSVREGDGRVTFTLVLPITASAPSGSR